MKLGIVGHGFVGSAVSHGFTKDLQKFIVDPKYFSQTFEYLTICLWIVQIVKHLEITRLKVVSTSKGSHGLAYGPRRLHFFCLMHN